MVRPVALLCVLFALSPAVADEPTLKPDPPAKPVEWPAVVPAFDLPANTYPTLFADHAGPFMLTGAYAGKETTRTVYDLRTGKTVGRWKSEDQPTSTHVLSPDGKLHVVLHTGNRPMAGAPQPPRTLVAFDTATGKRLWEAELSSFAYRLQFVGPNRVVVERGGGQVNGPVLYDVKTGKLVRELPAGAGPAMHLTASPGGAYLASVDRNNTVNIVSTENGAAVKQLTLPPPEPNRHWYVQELSFSPDGARLAAVYRVNAVNDRAFRILSWDLATGKQDADAQLPAPVAYWNPMLRWSADGKAWFVIGVGMVDPDTGTILWRRTFDQRQAAAYLPISADRLLLVSGTPTERTVREVVLPKERIAAVLKAVRSSGLAVDGWLPAPAKADRSAAEAVAVPPRADDWTYKPDPASAPAHKPLRLPLPVGRIVSAHVVGTAAVCELAESSVDSIAPRHLVRVDLATGKPTGRVELPHVARLADVAPGAEAAVTIDGEDTRRVDVWDLGTGKHVAGWRPAGVREPGGELLYASLLSADRALTLTRSGELAVWSVPQAKAVYAARVPGLGVPARSAGRKYLFALQGDTVRVIEAATGQLVGDLPADATPPPVSPPPGPWSHPPLAVRPDGEELAAILPSASAGPQVRRWDLITAKLSDRSAFPIPGIAHTSTVRYAGPDHLLLADTVLFGLTSQTVAWRYDRPAVMRPAAAANGRYWYVVGAFAPPAAAVAGAAPVVAAPGAVLIAAELPHPTVIAALKAAADNTADNLLGPGKSVGLKLDLSDPPDDKVKESIRAALADSLKVRGLEAADGKADVVLTLSARLVANGPMVTVRKLLPGQQGAGTAEKVVMPYLATRVELTADGEPVWTGGEVQYPPPFTPQPFRLPAKDTDLTAWLRERVWGRLPEEWGKLTLPRTLIRTPGGLVTLPGMSEFGPEGPRPVPRLD